MIYARLLFPVSRFRARSLLQTSSHPISTVYFKSLSATSNSNSSFSRLNGKKKRLTKAKITLHTPSGKEATRMASTKKVKKKPVTHSSLVSCHLQVISSNSSELTPSLYLFTDNRRFVFNCGENFQRFVTDHRLRILKDLMFFFTRVTWRNLGGFLGTSLTYRDGGNTHLNVYGPGRLAQFIELGRYFVGRERLKLVTNWDNSDVPCAVASTVASTCPNDVMTTSPSTHVYSDENVTITLVELEPKSVTGSDYRTSQETKIVDEICSLDDRDDVAPEPKRVKYNEDHSPLPCSTAAYICKVADVRGKFNVARAKELGLREGLAYKKLVSGKSVTAPNGRVVQPSDVLGETRIGPTFIVMECPDREHISAVTSHPKLQTEYFSNTGQEVVLIVHFSPLEVLQDDEYCRWAANFGESTRHLLLNESVCPTDICLRAWLWVQYPLYLMNPKVHHPPPIFKDRNPERLDLKLSHFFRDPKKAIIIGRSLLKFQLKPREKMGEDLSQVLRPIKDELPQHLDDIRSNDKLTSAIAAGQAMSMSESAIALKPSGSGSAEESSIVGNSKDEGLVHQSSSSGREQKINISDLTNTSPSVTNDVITDAIVEAKSEEEVDGRLSELCSDPKPRICDFNGADDAIITFLGTASTEPSKYRNVSGILIHTPNSGNFMLDCGEGSLSQIYRCFPEEVADEIILNLKAIFLSHVHADHHLGTVNVLQKREKLLAAKKRAREENLMASTDSATSDYDDVVIIAPAILINWITRYGELIEKLPCKLITCHTLTKNEVDENIQTKKNSAGVEDFHFETVPVIHCYDAYGVVVRHATGWSVVYSGDTRPCPRLIEAGQGASLLIHEATLEDKFLDLAVVKKHCTVSEALEVSDKMAPGFTILTHFSQRDPLIPSFLMTNQQLHSRVAIAMDCMSVNLKQLDQLPIYLPVMRDIFTEVISEDKSA